nr:nuclease-related domain-containing protein [Comamonas jiangduensis]
MAAVLQQVQGGMWLVLGLALGAMLLSVLVRSAAFKGWWGEYKVRRWLAQDLDAQHYHCAHNITLRRQDGSTTQIDHVVISPYGVFVLETKHLRGWIFGGEKQRTWTQTIYRHRTSFPSPLHQNWGHIKALEELLQLPLQHLHSVGVFTGDCQFKTAMPAHVTQGRAVTALIRSYREEVLDTPAVAQLVSALSHQRLEPMRSTHKAHVAQLQQRHALPSTSTARRKVMPSQPRMTPKAPAMPRQPALAPALGRRAATASVGAAHAGRTVAGARALPGLWRQRGAPQLPDSAGMARYFLRCERFPHCRFLQAEALEQAPSP